MRRPRICSNQASQNVLRTMRATFCCVSGRAGTSASITGDKTRPVKKNHKKMGTFALLQGAFHKGGQIRELSHVYFNIVNIVTIYEIAEIRAKPQNRQSDIHILACGEL